MPGLMPLLQVVDRFLSYVKLPALPVGPSPENPIRAPLVTLVHLQDFFLFPGHLQFVKRVLPQKFGKVQRLFERGRLECEPQEVSQLPKATHSSDPP